MGGYHATKQRQRAAVESLADEGLLADPGLREELNEWREAAAAGGKEWLVTRVRAALGTPEGHSARTHALEVRAERDLAVWLHAEAKHQHAELLAQRDSWWDHVGREQSKLTAERDTLQARIDAVLAHVDTRTHALASDLAYANERDTLRFVRAVLQGEQPTGEADRD